MPDIASELHATFRRCAGNEMGGAHMRETWQVIAAKAIELLGPPREYSGNITQREDGLLKAYAAHQAEIAALKAQIAELQAQAANRRHS